MSQANAIYQMLLDYRPHPTTEIQEKIYGGTHLGVARIGARICDIKKKFGVRIDSRRTENPTIWEYQLKRPLDREDLFT